MTALERQRRRMQKASFLNSKKGDGAARKKFSPLLTKKASRSSLLLSRRGGSGKNRSTSDPLSPPRHHHHSRGDGRETHNRSAAILPRIDSITVKAMKAVVADLLHDLGGRCTVLALANAMTTDPLVSDVYAMMNEADDDGYHDYDDGWMSRRVFGVSVRSVVTMGRKSSRRRGHADAGIGRRYALMNALNELEKRPSSSTRTVSSWEEAAEELRSVVDLAGNKKEGDDGTTLDRKMAAAEEEKTEETVVGNEGVSGITRYLERLKSISRGEIERALDRPSARKWQQISSSKLSPPIGKEDEVEAEAGAEAETETEGKRGGLDDADRAMEERLVLAYKERDERIRSAAVDEVEARLRQREREEALEAEARAREEEARERALALMRPLSEDEQRLVHTAMNHIGPESEVIAQVGPDSCQRGSLRRLLPGEWLNDEVIHYFYIMLSKRDEEMCQSDPDRKRCHFFKSFFMTKLLNEGNADPDLDGTYEYRNVKRWSKKVPGKDIFQLDKIFFPINQGQMHWVCAVVYMREKRIQFYDSMGGDGMDYLESLMQYLKDEHQDKMKAPLPDADEWTLVPCTTDTPRQRNGFDCGVFTCMFADFLSKGCPLVFDQSHVTQCRERIALSILNGKAIM